MSEEFYSLIKQANTTGIPKCAVDGCTANADNTGHRTKDGHPKYRQRFGVGPICTTHHRKFTKEAQALEYKKESYCENIDNRLGYVCTATIVKSSQLTVDHINGDPLDERPENKQTLCRNCHDYKTHLFKDYKTPGRKTLKMTSWNNTSVDTPEHFSSVIAVEALNLFKEVKKKSTK